MMNQLENELPVENLLKLLIFLNALALIAANRNVLPDPSFNKNIVPSKVFLQADDSPIAFLFPLFPDLIMVYEGELPPDQLMAVCPNGRRIEGPKIVSFNNLSSGDKLDYTTGLDARGQQYLKNQTKKITIANLGSAVRTGCPNPKFARSNP